MHLYRINTFLQVVEYQDILFYACTVVFSFSSHNFFYNFGSSVLKSFPGVWPPPKAFSVAGYLLCIFITLHHPFKWKLFE